MSIFGSDIDLKPLLDRIGKLETTCSTLLAERRALDLEFTELYDKVRHQMSRMAKRHSAAQKNTEDGPELSTESERFNHLDPVSKSIMLRRGGYEGKR